MATRMTSDVDVQAMVVQAYSLLLLAAHLSEDLGDSELCGLIRKHTEQSWQLASSVNAVVCGRYEHKPQAELATA